MQKGALKIDDFDLAADQFAQLCKAHIHEKLIFGLADEIKPADVDEIRPGRGRDVHGSLRGIGFSRPGRVSNQGADFDDIPCRLRRRFSGRPLALTEANDLIRTQGPTSRFGRHRGQVPVRRHNRNQIFVRMQGNGHRVHRQGKICQIFAHFPVDRRKSKPCACQGN